MTECGNGKCEEGEEGHCPEDCNVIVPDADDDGVPDEDDNCPQTPNEGQADVDDDGTGDACQDTDEDGLLDVEDNCPDLANPEQLDSDGDDAGDECDPDDDNDGVEDGVDNCLNDSNEAQADLDEDGLGDVCDNCPLVAGEDQTDTDNDGAGDLCDVCPQTPDPGQEDEDGDGQGDACDRDLDNDGADDEVDNCPLIPNEDQANNDEDSLGDACDNCPTVTNQDQIDTDPYVAVVRAGAFSARPTQELGSLALADDEVSGPLDLGFEFEFFGQAHTQVRVGSNGFVTFNDEGDVGVDGQILPDVSAPNGLVAAFWEDLDPTEGNGELRVGTLGEAPTREFVVSFSEVEHFGGGSPVSFQVVLRESVGTIEIHCISCLSNGDETHTQGVESLDGRFGVTLPGRNRADFSLVEDAVVISTGQAERPDGVGDACDVCPGLFNPSQSESDGDGLGDVCDNCPGDFNDDQTDTDGDGEGDACEGFPALCANGSGVDCNPEGATLIPGSAFVDPAPPEGWVQCAGFINTEGDDVRWDWENNCLGRSVLLRIRGWESEGGALLWDAILQEPSDSLFEPFHARASNVGGSEGLHACQGDTPSRTCGVTMWRHGEDTDRCGCNHSSGLISCDDIFTANAANDEAIYIGGRAAGDNEIVLAPPGPKNSCTFEAPFRRRVQAAIYEAAP